MLSMYVKFNDEVVVDGQGISSFIEQPTCSKWDTSILFQ